MASSIEIPTDLLKLMDIQAKARGLTRERFILQVLRRSCGNEASSGQKKAATPLGRAADAQQAVEEMALALRRRHDSGNLPPN